MELHGNNILSLRFNGFDHAIGRKRICDPTFVQPPRTQEHHEFFPNSAIDRIAAATTWRRRINRLSGVLLAGFALWQWAGVFAGPN